jgi:hypothetical protein
MITQVINLLVAMYEAIGPGFLLAMAFPVLLVVFALVVFAGLKRAAQGSARS